MSANVKQKLFKNISSPKKYRNKKRAVDH